MKPAYRDFSMQFQYWNENCLCTKSMAHNGGWIHFEQGPHRLCSIFFGKAIAEDLDKAVEALNKGIPNYKPSDKRRLDASEDPEAGKALTEAINEVLAEDAARDPDDERPRSSWRRQPRSAGE